MDGRGGTEVLARPCFWIKLQVISYLSTLKRKMKYSINKIAFITVAYNDYKCITILNTVHLLLDNSDLNLLVY